MPHHHSPLLQLADGFKRQWRRFPGLPARRWYLWSSVGAGVVMLVGVSVWLGYQGGLSQAEQDAMAQQQALIAERDAALAEAAREREALQSELDSLSQQIREQVITAEASTDSVEQLQADLTDLRQRHAELIERYETRNDQLAAAEQRISVLEQRLRQQE